MKVVRDVSSFMSSFMSSFKWFSHPDFIRIKDVTTITYLQTAHGNGFEVNVVIYRCTLLLYQLLLLELYCWESFGQFLNHYILVFNIAFIAENEALLDPKHLQIPLNMAERTALEQRQPLRQRHVIVPMTCKFHLR